MKLFTHIATRYDPRRVAMGASLGISFLMLAGKGVAYFVTGSQAIFSDAAESVVHLFATGFAAFSLWYAAVPADESHPYGHGKVAYFAAGLEGGLVLLAGVGVVYSAVEALLAGHAPQELGLGLIVIGGLCLVNLLLGWLLVRTGRQHGSLVLVSNGQHVLADMWTSLGVLVGVGLVWLTGLVWLDPLVALLVAGNLFWTAYRLIGRSVTGLMERADPDVTRRLIEILEEVQRDGLIRGFHQVRHRRVENTLWIDCHLLFPEALSLTEAHARTNEVESAVKEGFPDEAVHVTAHLEPDAHERAHPEDHDEPTDPLREVLNGEERAEDVDEQKTHGGS